MTAIVDGGPQMEEVADSISSDSPTIGEMIDLALGTPEVGAVNFNILRLVLHDLVQQLGLDNVVANLDDFNLNQVEKYRNYIEGNAQSTPMPMVLRVNQQNGGAFGGGPISSRQDSSRMRTPARSGRDEGRSQSQPGRGGGGGGQGGGGPTNQGQMDGGNRQVRNQNNTGQNYSAPGSSRDQGSFAPHQSKGDTNIGNDGREEKTRSGRHKSRRNVKDGGTDGILGDSSIEDRLYRLEKNLEFLYQMPPGANPLTSTGTGTDRQGGAPAGPPGQPGAGGNDMWQIIQLNNRVVSCETALQKMATLLEDLALDQNQLRGDTHEVRGHAEHLIRSHGDLCNEISPLSERCALVQEALDELREDLALIKEEWKHEINQIFAGNLDKLPPSLQTQFKQQMKGHQQDESDGPDFDYDKAHGRLPPAFQKLTKNTIPFFPVGELAKMDLKEINAIPKSVLKHMNPEQKDAIARKQAESRPKPNLNMMKADEIKQLNIGDLEKLTAAEISNIKPSKMVFLKPEVRNRFDEIRNPSTKKQLNFYSMPPQSIPGVPLAQLEQLTPSEAANIGEEILRQMTPEQRRVVKEIAKHTPPKSFPGLSPVVLEPQVISKLPPEEFMRMDQSQLKRLTIEQLNAMTVEQRDVVDTLLGLPDSDNKQGKKRRSSQRSQSHHGYWGGGRDRSDSPLSDGGGADRRGRSKNRDKRGQRDRSRDKEYLYNMSFSDPQGHHIPGHTKEHHAPIDIIKGKIGRPENLTPISKEETIDLVQEGLQRQYVKLQEQQKKLADDIETKMQMVYEKLFKEIVTQDHTLPYMSLGEPAEAILGPGVCTLAGMPPGVAVCQFPEAEGKGGHPKPVQHDKKVCPGVGLCPANENCPHCNALAQSTGKTGPGLVVPPPPKSKKEMEDAEFPTEAIHPEQAAAAGTGAVGDESNPVPVDPEAAGEEGEGQTSRGSQSSTGGGTKKSKSQSVTSRGSQVRSSKDVPKHLQDMLLQEMKSLVLVDLEKIREDMKTKEVSVFDEADILERLDTIWEAIKIIKGNEETLAVKILRQDAVLSKLPKDTIDKINQIPTENLDAIATAKWDKPMMLPAGSIGGGSERRSADKGKPPKGQTPTSYLKSPPSNSRIGGGSAAKPADASGGIGSQEVATLYNNISNLIAETTHHKTRIEEIGDQVKIMEAGMVTKIMLQDIMNDKADKGDVNTKVSYEEFGRAVDDLSTNLKDLVNESFNNSEHWKQVTDHLAEDLTEKMDKSELAPLKTYFKSNLKALDDKVRQLQMSMDEPDPAGTRKKLLKDYNCISCDRRCNISGITNAPTLPLLGPIMAGHTTASRRAFDLHRMRIKKKIEQTCKDLPMMERQLKCLGLLNADGSLKRESELHKVNRFHGGSHTAITTSARIRASHRQSSLSKAVAAPEPAPTPYNEEEGEGAEEMYFMPSIHNMEMYGEYEEEEEEEEEMAEVPPPPEQTIMEVVAEVDEGREDEMEGEGYEEMQVKRPSRKSQGRQSGLQVLPEPEEMMTPEEMEQNLAYAEVAEE